MGIVWALARDGLTGLGLLCVMTFVFLVLVLWSDRRRRREITRCTWCRYQGSHAQVTDHQRQDHPV